jgi:hypothetical protein
MRIACLHTAESNIAVYEDAGIDLAIASGALRHRVRADLLSAAEDAGALTAGIEAETVGVLLDMTCDADVVILNCSTLGAAAASAAAQSDVPILRADGALAQRAVRAGGRTVVLCTTRTTIATTTALFKQAAETTGAEIDVRLIDGAWALFRADDLDAYCALIAAETRKAYDEGADAVAYAQASMTAATRLLDGSLPQPLTGPASALTDAVLLATPHERRS